MEKEPSPSPAKISYRDLDPLEQGGRTARDGFDYQDHVAVAKCIEMLLGVGALEVWCETEDDVVLVWADEQSAERFEFVQVKGTDLKQAWTVAKLCAQEASKNGPKRSILEKSLAHDRGKEKCWFRLVTKWPPDEVLNVLTAARTSRAIGAIAAEMQDLVTKIEGVLSSNVASPNGNGIKYWVDQSEWEHRASTDDVRNLSLVNLARVLEQFGQPLASDQLSELHAYLYRRVQDASLADGKTQKEKKRLLRDELKTDMLQRVYEIQHPGAGGAAPLKRKLKDASIDDAGVNAAQELRRRYLSEARAARYLSLDDREFLESEVIAKLHELKMRLDTGHFSDTPQQFLVRCLDELKSLHSASGEPLPEGLVKGFMYEAMNRCLHRLTRVGT